MNKLLIGLAVVLLIGLVYWYTESLSTPAAKVIYYSSPTCPHCKNFDPTWERLVAFSQGWNVEMQKISCKSGECPVAAFPTIVGYHKGVAQNYSGDRSYASLVGWMLGLLR